MRGRRSLGEILWPDDEQSRRQAIDWAESIAEQALDLVWRAFDRLAAHELRDRPDLAAHAPEQLERELTQRHAAELTVAWARETGGYGSFCPLHESHEPASRKGGKAMPPSNDFAFVHMVNKRWSLPVEAKVLWSDRALGEYLKDVNGKYLEGVAAPLVGECGMIGYLLKGTAEGVFEVLKVKLAQQLGYVQRFADRTHRTTTHDRKTAPRLRIHHMVMSCAPREGSGEPPIPP